MSNHGASGKSYTVHALVMLGFALALGVLAFSLVAHHRAVPDEVNGIHAAHAAPGAG